MTNLPYPEVTVPVLLDTFEKVCNEMPKRKNPVGFNDECDEFMCLYTDEQDDSRHCVAGTVFVRLDIDLPTEFDPASSVFGVSWAAAGDDPRAVIVNTIQRHADGPAGGERESTRAWGDLLPVIATLRDDYMGAA